MEFLFAEPAGPDEFRLGFQQSEAKEPLTACRTAALLIGETADRGDSALALEFFETLPDSCRSTAWLSVAAMSVAHSNRLLCPAFRKLRGQGFEARFGWARVRAYCGWQVGTAEIEGLAAARVGMFRGTSRRGILYVRLLVQDALAATLAGDVATPDLFQAMSLVEEDAELAGLLEQLGEDSELPDWALRDVRPSTMRKLLDVLCESEPSSCGSHDNPEPSKNPAPG